MTPEHWQKVKELLHATMQQQSSQRSKYLDSACPNDPSLRDEVESLLCADEKVRTSFLEVPPLEHISLAQGTQLGPYVIICPIGAGGMGEVYRARDPRLSRDVAIKVLPAILPSNSERLRRFEREACAAAALNHPAILAVYDVNINEQTTPYIVCELLEGESLRERLYRGLMPFRKVVEYALQVANGLAAAHAKGIVHRDLKPENLFVTKDDRIKILDFGLAKLVQPETEREAAVSTIGLKTEAGAVMGTLGYMSPEQLCGQVVDHRSDIFSLGAILYEMLSGERAFEGKTRAETITAIRSHDPPDLTAKIPAISPGCNRLVHHCLEKNPDHRFHSARDLAFALEAISDTGAPGAITGTSAVPTEWLQKKRLLLNLSLAGLLLLGMALAIWYYRAERPAPAPSQWMQLTNFPDSVTEPALSPDGRVLAFVRTRGDFPPRGNIYIKMLPQGEPVQLTRDENMKMSLAFCPDGSRISYSVAPSWDTWVVPVLGGESRLLLPNASGLTWIDAQHILFSEEKRGVHMAVVTANESRAGQRDVYVPAHETGMAHNSYLSPDRKWVLVTEMGPWKGYGWMPCRLVPFDGSSPGHPVGPDASCVSAAWSVDGKWMFFSSNAGGFGGALHIWRQKFPDGKPEQLTSGPTTEQGIAVSPDGRSLITSVGVQSSTVSAHDKSGDRQMVFEGSANLPTYQAPSRAVFSPDGSKLYFFGQNEPTHPQELWMGNVKTGQTERVLPGTEIASSFDISPDGKQVAFDSPDENGEPHVWIATLDHRTPPRRFASSSLEFHPLFGPSGDLYFEVKEGDRIYVYARSLDGSNRRKALLDPIVRLATISPDGQWLLAEAPLSGEVRTRGVVAFNLHDGSSRRICHNLCFVRWTYDGKFLCVSLPHGDGKALSSPVRKSFLIPLRRGHYFPPLPAAGIQSETDLAHLPGVRIINEWLRPGPDISIYAFDQSTEQRNLYRVPLP
jgi:serine/threonine protein kinase/Tol biopolymer transport system component